MEQRLENEIRDRLTEMSVDMEKYETRWIEIDEDFETGLIIFKHGNGHNIDVKFGFDEDGDITDFRIDMEY